MLNWRKRVQALIAAYLAGSETIVKPEPAQLGQQQLQGTVGDIVWGSCGNNTLPRAECGYAIVPLDYSDLSAGVAKIALGRLNATGSRKGSLFVNPGGPGGPGVGLATQAGDVFHQLVGEEYDIVGFDPRGIGLTEPATRCFTQPGSRMQFITNTVLDRSYDVGPNLTDPFNRFHLIETQRDADGLSKAQFAICAQTMGDQLRYMGTTTVVRDIDFITTLLDGKDALINFYGLSYGTIIGQYLVNMFPKRVGRVAIDGVIDADIWTTYPPFKWLRTFSSSTDSTYRLFAEECAKAGPAGCALSKSTAEKTDDIFHRVEDFISKLYTEPLAVPNATLPGILTNGRVRTFVVSLLSTPENWPTLATALSNAMAGDGTMLLNAYNEKDLVDVEDAAVICSDVKPFPPPAPEAVVDEGLDVSQHVTVFYFATLTFSAGQECQFWPFTPPERFSGPWNNTLSNPILVISNTNDPSTSLLGGESVSKALGASAALLVQDGPGHTSFALSSQCTLDARRAFFANGTLPAAGIVCPVDESPFPPPADGASTLVSSGVKNLATVGGGDLRDGLRRVAKFVHRR